jgi:hypothetical protein
LQIHHLAILPVTALFVFWKPAFTNFSQGNYFPATRAVSFRSVLSEKSHKFLTQLDGRVAALFFFQLCVVRFPEFELEALVDTPTISTAPPTPKIDPN